MMKRIFSFILATLLLVSLATPTYAYQVGENVKFEAEDADDELVGNVDADKEESDNKSTGSQSNSAWDQVSKKCSSYAKSTMNTKYTYYVPTSGGYVMYWVANTRKTKLEEICNLVDKYEAAGWLPTNTPTVKKENSGGGYTDEEKAALGEIVEDKLGIGLSSMKQYSYITNMGGLEDKLEKWYTEWEEDKIGLPPSMTKQPEWSKVLKEYGPKGSYVRQPAPSGLTLIDCKKTADRYELLESYLDIWAEGNSVRTIYIVEYRIQDSVQAALRKTTPAVWPGTSQTHFWEIIGLESPTGLDLGNTERFSNSTLDQVFYYAGKYRVKATQIMQNTYYNAITWTKNEYWVVAETGQIIWAKQTSRGPQISTEKPMSEQGLWNVNYYEETEGGTFYLTQFDEIIEVEENIYNGGYQTPSAWGDDYTSNRIE